MRIKLLLALVAGFSMGCAGMPGASKEQPPAVPVDSLALEYEVYAMLLAHWGVTGKSSVVLYQETEDTSGPDPFDETAKRLKLTLQNRTPVISVSKETLESYRSKMNDHMTLDPARLGVADLRILSAQEVDAYHSENEDAWRAFHEQYGAQASIVTFSRVGFSKDWSRALLTLSRSCGRLCKSGTFLLLEKSEDRWRIVARVRNWET